VILEVRPTVADRADAARAAELHHRIAAAMGGEGETAR
jgi:hypothetical protein